MRSKVVWITVLVLAVAAAALACGGGGAPELGGDALDLVWDGGYWDQRNWK